MIYSFYLILLKIKNAFFLFILIVYFSLLGKTFAYVDPGTGSIILQAIVWFLAVSIAIVSFYWNKFKMFILKIFKKEKKSEKD